MALNVLIVGGGIVGLTAASVLRQQDHNVDLVEIRPAFGEQAGVGLTIVPNALRALSTIGVADRCMDVGMPSYGMMLFDMENRPMPQGRPAGSGGRRDGNIAGETEYPGIGIGRTIFHRILADAAIEKGANIRFGLTVDAIEDGPESALVRFTDGGERRYDLVLGADGIYSAMRERLFPGVHPAQTGQAIWRASAPRPQAVRQTHQYLGGRHGVVGVCPISEDVCYVYVIEKSDGSERFDRDELHSILRERLEGYPGHIPEIAASLDNPETVNFRHIESLLAPRPWRRGRAAIVGDAAHAGPPVLAQGAAMGIEDVVVLGQELAKRHDDVPASLAAVVERRFPRVKMVVDTSVALCKAQVEPGSVPDLPILMGRIGEELSRPI